MTVRAIWLISLAPDTMGNVLYFRTFPTVERRAEFLHGSQYVKLPSVEEFSKSVMFSLGLVGESKQYIEWRDKASQTMQLPAVTIKVGRQELWPILIIEQVSCLLCCFPFIEDSKNLSLIESSAVSIGFAVLIGILNFIGPSCAPKSKMDKKFMDLDNYLTLSMPFGTPVDSEPLNVIDFYNSSALTLSKKHNSSTQDPKKIKSSVLIEINEFIRSSQCDQQELQPVVDVYGNVIATVDSIGHTNDVSITLEHSNVSKTLFLKSLIIHPCVQTFTSTGGEGVAAIPKKLWFAPPAHRFTLCFYSVPHSVPPVQGTFKLKGTTSVELLIQLKLVEILYNAYESFDVFIPFFNRGPISNFEFKATYGLLQVSEDKHSLKWNIGSKLSPKLEIMLTAKVEFSDGTMPSYNDPFCVHKNSYVQINFKLKNTTLSGCNIDPKSVVMSPACKAKVNIERTVYATEYRIWNSFGDLPYPGGLEEEIPKELTSTASKDILS